MRYVSVLAFASSFAVLGLTQVLDLGDLNQFSPNITALPAGLEASDIWIGQGVDDGFNVVLGQDLRDLVQVALQASTDEECYTDVMNALNLGNVQMDQNIERRGFASLLSKTFKSRFAIFAIIFGALKQNWRLKSMEANELGSFIPAYIATSAGNIAFSTGAVVTISAGGTVVATITQSADATSLIGSAAPSVTAVTSSIAGYVSGDLMALLDETLASRIDEMMHRSLDCQDGHDFDVANPATKRDGLTYGSAICAAEAVMVGAVPDGPFNDLLLFNSTQLPFQFADSQVTLAHAASVFADFVQAYAPLLKVSPELANQLAVFVFVLAYDTVVQGNVLAEQNRIASSIIKTTSLTTATSTSSSCPDPTTLACGMTGEDCALRPPINGNNKAYCRDGEHKDCKCPQEPTIFADMVSPDQRSSMQHMLGMLNSIFTPVCPVASTDVPSTIFSSDTNKVYTLFCAGWQSGTASSLTVDAAGNKRVPQPQSKRKRTPPANTANYVNWNFDLSFTPAVGGPTCSTDCTGAYAKIASACTSNSGGSYIYESASINVGCGTFASKVYNPTTALTTGPQFCYQKTDFAPLNNDGVNERTLTINAGVACAGSGVNMIKKDQNSTFRNWMTYGNGAPYQYNIWWKPGCLLENSRTAIAPTEVYAANPLMVTNPGNAACTQPLINNWKNCNNGGVGGNVQVGCLIYEFKADKNKRVF